jgi:hypothetical protein
MLMVNYDVGEFQQERILPMSSNDIPEIEGSQAVPEQVPSYEHILSIVDGYMEIITTLNPPMESYLRDLRASVKSIDDAYVLVKVLDKEAQGLMQREKGKLVYLERYESNRLLLEGCIEVMRKPSGLTENQAKTCVYWSVGTYDLEKMQRYPVLAFQGVFGTGKSDSMKTMEQFVHKPALLGSGSTPAALRDELAKANEATAFIEEADGIDEKLILRRYERGTSKVTVKKAISSGVYTDIGLDLFGATVLHKRKPFKDLALTDRSIVIKTKKREGDFAIPDLSREEGERRMQLLWDEAKRYPAEFHLQGRSGDVWQPLMNKAWALGDAVWCLYAMKEVGKAMKKAKAGAGYEVDNVVLLALHHKAGGASRQTRVSLKDVRDFAKNEYNLWLTPQQIHQIADDLGFEVKVSEGITKVIVPPAQLEAKMDELGLKE